jgi:SAM-dependent methyltransferase
MRFEKRFMEFIESDSTNEQTSSNLGLADEWKWYLMQHMWRYKIYLSSIPLSPEPLRILDIGTTHFTLFLKEYCPSYEISTCDITSLFHDKCKARDIHFAKVDLSTEPIPFPNDHFNIVIFAEVLEHLFTPPTRIMKEIYRILQPSGKLTLSVPNIASLSHRVRLLLGISPLQPPDRQMTPTPNTGYPHLREYTMSECVNILKNCGFSIEKKKFLNAGVLALASRKTDGLFTRGLNIGYSLLCYTVPSFGSEICVYAKKPR